MDCLHCVCTHQKQGNEEQQSGVAQKMGLDGEDEVRLVAETQTQQLLLWWCCCLCSDDEIAGDNGVVDSVEKAVMMMVVVVAAVDDYERGVSDANCRCLRLCSLGLLLCVEYADETNGRMGEEVEEVWRKEEGAWKLEGEVGHLLL